MICIIGLFASGSLYAFSKEVIYDLTHQISNESLEILTINKKNISVSPFRRNANENVLTEERLQQLSEEFDLELDDFRRSYGVIIQNEVVSARIPITQEPSEPGMGAGSGTA